MTDFKMIHIDINNWFIDIYEWFKKSYTMIIYIYISIDYMINSNEAALQIIEPH